MASLTNTTTIATETALRERCMNAEAEVDRLQKENTILKKINVGQSRSVVILTVKVPLLVA